MSAEVRTAGKLAAALEGTRPWHTRTLRPASRRTSCAGRSRRRRVLRVRLRRELRRRRRLLRRRRLVLLGFVRLTLRGRVWCRGRVLAAPALARTTAATSWAERDGGVVTSDTAAPGIDSVRADHREQAVEVSSATVGGVAVAAKDIAIEYDVGATALERSARAAARVAYAAGDSVTFAKHATDIIAARERLPKAASRTRRARRAASRASTPTCRRRSRLCSGSTARASCLSRTARCRFQSRSRRSRTTPSSRTATARPSSPARAGLAERAGAGDHHRDESLRARCERRRGRRERRRSGRHEQRGRRRDLLLGGGRAATCRGVQYGGTRTARAPWTRAWNGPTRGPRRVPIGVERHARVRRARARVSRVGRPSRVRGRGGRRRQQGVDVRDLASLTLDVSPTCLAPPALSPPRPPRRRSRCACPRRAR